MTLQAPQEPLFPGDIYILCVMAENGQNASKKSFVESFVLTLHRSELFFRKKK